MLITTLSLHQIICTKCQWLNSFKIWRLTDFLFGSHLSNQFMNEGRLNHSDVLFFNEFRIDWKKVKTEHKFEMDNLCNLAEVNN